jgi:hypothetical protein
MDGKTDAFCGIVFEDVFVRSSVVYDSLNPRYVPWSTRAFMLHQAHPSSILMLGLFDYDEGPLKVDDPIGRIALHLGNFSTDTMYTLTYPLYHGDTQAEDVRERSCGVHTAGTGYCVFCQPRLMNSLLFWMSLIANSIVGKLHYDYELNGTSGLEFTIHYPRIG